MSLRLRLIVAFFVLSVVPLGAVTFYTYTNNVRAVREAATREADLLAGELTQRMQLVTEQLSARVEHLMDLPQAQQAGMPPATPAPKAAAPPAAVTRGSAGASATTGVTPGTVNPEALSTTVAQQLGEAAMLLNNVELRGLRFGGGRGSGRGRTGPREGQPGEQAGTVAPGEASGAAGAGASGGAAPPVTGATPPTSSGASAAPPVVGENVPRFTPPNLSGAPRFRPRPGGSASRTGREGAASGQAAGAGAPGTPPAPGAPGTPPAPGAPGTPPAPPGVVTGSGNGILIDLSPIRREIYRQILPEGRGETLTPEERQRIAREVNQRLLGIAQGIQLSAAGLQQKAQDAQRLAEQAKTAAAQARPQAKAAVVSPPAAAPMKRTAELSGSHLGVMREQNGKVVQQVSAEVNLPNLLATVFSTTRRDRGEVPFAVGKDGHLYVPTDQDRQTIEDLGNVAKPDSPLGTTVLPEWIVVTTADPTGSGLRFGIARPVGNSLNDLRRTAARNAGVGLLFIGAALVVIVPLSGRLTRNLSSLTEGVGRIARGDFGARVPVRSTDEVGRLAGAFNQMAEDVERHQRAAVEQERIRRELELGRRIQHDMQPRESLRLGLTEIVGVSVPAREVGGDFFNYFELAPNQVALLVGDVSGKGVGAALLMSNIQAALRTRISLGQNLSAIAEAIDRDIEVNSPGPLYATLFLAILDQSARQLRYVNCGHHPQYVLRTAGGLDRMPSTGLPVGLLAGRGYVERHVQFQAGDMVFFYTDGCVDAENEAGEMFGQERLEAVLTSAPASAAPEMLQRVEQALQAFRGTREPFDDETMMAVKIG
jgi:serine phosphatase RsbU (regulator of sigma subunit)